MKLPMCNLRASWTMPFKSKTDNINLIDIATRVMVSVPVPAAIVQPIDIGCIATSAMASSCVAVPSMAAPHP